MKLYNYYRSSTSYRVRIALALKDLAYEYVAVDLRLGRQRDPAYLELNAQGLVPTLELDDGTRLSQSMAIIEYLDRVHSSPALIPAGPVDAARVRALAQIVACEIHPLDNLRVLQYLSHELNVDAERRNRWYRHWVRVGLQAYEQELARAPSTFSHGEQPSLADCCLVPQIYNAQRFDCDLSGLPNVMRVHAACLALPAFRRADPAACPDAVAP